MKNCIVQKKLSILVSKEGECMDKAKKRIRTCMVCVVLTAVVVGILYYYHETQDKSMSGEGTLIAATNVDRYSIWQK